MSSRNFSLRSLVRLRYGDGFPKWVESFTSDPEELAFLFYFALHCYVQHPEYLIRRYLPEDLQSKARRSIEKYNLEKLNHEKK